MTNTQLFIAVGVPVLVMIVGFVLQGRSIDNLRNEMLARFEAANQRIDSNFNALNTRIDGLERRIGVIESDLRQFYSITGNHEGRISAFEKH